MRGTQGDRLDMMNYIKSSINLQGYFVKLHIIIEDCIQCELPKTRGVSENNVTNVCFLIRSFQSGRVLVCHQARCGTKQKTSALTTSHESNTDKAS